MVKFEIIRPSEDGIMFLHDVKFGFTVPDILGDGPVYHTEDCVAFHTLIYLDGNSKIILNSGNLFNERQYYAGKIKCPSKVLSLSDSRGFIYISAPLKDSFAIVEISMSDPKFPETIECNILNLE